MKSVDLPARRSGKSRLTEAVMIASVKNDPGQVILVPTQERAVEVGRLLWRAKKPRCRVVVAGNLRGVVCSWIG